MPSTPSKAAVDAACAEIAKFIGDRRLLLHSDRSPEYPSTQPESSATFRERADAFVHAVTEWDSSDRLLAPKGFLEVGLALAGLYCFFGLAAATCFRSPLLNFWTFTQHIESKKGDEFVEHTRATWDQVHVCLAVLFNAADTAIEQVANGTYRPPSRQRAKRVWDALQTLMDFVDAILLSRK